MPAGEGSAAVEMKISLEPGGDVRDVRGVQADASL
jgi:hypothetical protein